MHEDIGTPVTGFTMVICVGIKRVGGKSFSLGIYVRDKGLGVVGYVGRKGDGVSMGNLGLVLVGNVLIKDIGGIEVFNNGCDKMYNNFPGVEIAGHIRRVFHY